MNKLWDFGKFCFGLARRVMSTRAVHSGVGLAAFLWRSALDSPRFKGFCKYGLGLSLLSYVVWKNWYPPAGSETGGLADALGRPIQVTPLLVASLIYLASVLLTFVRWYVLVRALELPFTLFNAIRLGLIGFFLSTFLPGSIGGDIFKAAFIAREQSRRTAAVATVLIDRVVGLWGLFWLVVLLGGFFWGSGNPALRERSLQVVVLGSAAVVGVSVVVWVLVGVLPQWRAARLADSLERLPKIGHSAAEFWRALWMYRCQRRRVALALALAVVGHVGFVLTFYFAAQTFLGGGTLQQIPSLAEHFIIVPVGMTIQAVFPTPGGVGGGEYGFGKLYTLIGKSEELGVLGSLVSRVVSWVLGLIGYLIYLRMKPALEVGGASTTAGPHACVNGDNGEPPQPEDSSVQGESHAT